MKIKSQFSIFLTGIIILPILVVTIISSIFMNHKAERIAVPSYDTIIGEENSDFTVNPETWKKVQKKLSFRPNTIEYAILNSNYKVLMSSIDDLQNSSVLTQTEIFNLIENQSKNYIYQIEFVDSSSNQNSDRLWILTRLAHSNLKKPNKLFSPYMIVTIVLIVLFIFCVIMILIITRSINNYIEKMRDELQENEKRRMRFIMGLSHDLRTPIALIKGYAEALNDGMVEDENDRTKSLEIIINKAEILNERIDELIDFAKLNTNEWRQNLKSYKINDFLTNFSKRFKLDAELIHRNFSFDIKIPKEKEILFDEKLFTRVLENLTGNSCRYTKDDGKICLCAKEIQNSNAKSIKIEIIDDGIGIKKEDLSAIFDPLFRGTNSRNEDGKGLGLAIVKSIIESHGWKIEVESKINEGSTFIITIPS